MLPVRLGVFLLTKSIGKLIEPGHAIGIGIAEAGLSLLILMGVWKRLSYGLGRLVHRVSLVASARPLHHSLRRRRDHFVAGIPTLAAFYPRCLLQDYDPLWTVGR